MLGEVINGRPLLNEYGLITKQEIENLSSIRKECIIDKFVIMPNHIHLIVQIIVGDDGNRPVEPRAGPVEPRAGPVEPRAGPVEPRADCHPPLRKSVSNMVQGFKGAVTRQIGFSLWQRSFHDHIIRNEQDYIRIAEYIENNPANWNEDCYFGGTNT